MHRLTTTGTLVVDCQSGLLDNLNTRFVVPLIPAEESPAPAKRLNPVFQIAGSDYVMATQFAAAVQKRDFGDVVASVEHRALEVIDALDVLVTGV